MVKREIERYGIYLAELDPIRGSEIAKTRPVVVVSLDVLNRQLHTVVACPLTTKLHPHWRTRIEIVCAGRRAEIAVDQIRALSKERFGKRIDALEPTSSAKLRRLITEMYGGQ